MDAGTRTLRRVKNVRTFSTRFKHAPKVDISSNVTKAHTARQGTEAFSGRTPRQVSEEASGQVAPQSRRPWAGGARTAYLWKRTT